MIADDVVDLAFFIELAELANKQEYQVFRPTLAGFFNPEIHRRVVNGSDGKFIAEAKC